MFVGAGAGKLPTASAVVSDVVDAVKHLGRNIMTNWSSKKLELTHIDKSEKQFFVRVEGTPEAKLEEVKSVFGEVKLVQVPEANNEFGVVTEVMSEESYKEKAAKLDGIINMIRIEA